VHTDGELLWDMASGVLQLPVTRGLKAAGPRFQRLPYISDPPVSVGGGPPQAAGNSIELG
jgi:hypothetical protein